MSMEPDCVVFLLKLNYPNCSSVLNWIGPGLALCGLLMFMIYSTGAVITKLIVFVEAVPTDYV